MTPPQSSAKALESFDSPRDNLNMTDDVLSLPKLELESRTHLWEFETPLPGCTPLRSGLRYIEELYLSNTVLKCNKFLPPPLDGSLTYPELFDWHLSRSKTHPIFVYSEDAGTAHQILWPEGVRAIQTAARIVRLAVDGDQDIAPDYPRVVAILSSADTFTFFAMLVGIVRAGHTAFPISIRNSPQAIAHLLKKTNATHLVLGCEAPIQALATESFELLDKLTTSRPTTFPMPVFKELFRGAEWDDFVPLSFSRPDLDSAAIILHSSGSTDFPKPITWTHYRMLQLAIRPYFGERDLCGLRLASHSVPMFHGMGMMLTGWTASVGLILSSFRPQTPAFLPTPESVMQGAIHTKSNIIFCVPSFIETWASQSECVQYLKTIDGIVFSGGPLNKAKGDALAMEGISLFMFFGCTESGIYNSMFPKSVGMDWDYFDIAECVDVRFVPDGFGNAELIVVPNKFVLPCVLNTEIDGVPAYASKDLLTPHPTKQGYWRVYGRVDDQIMHSTGEKTNPGPLETILNQDEHIKSAVIFGRSRFHAGVVVDPRPDLRFDPTDMHALAAFRNAIWPSFERMNEFAPRHSRIFKEMILVSKPSKPFTYTAKNTARRQAIINTYEDEINELYRNVEETSQPGVELPLNWDAENTRTFVYSVVSAVMKQDLHDDEDIFQKGCDSLQATWIRNTLLSALRKCSISDSRNVPSNFVYKHPTVTRLSYYVRNLLRATKAAQLTQEDDEKLDLMRTLESKYIKDLLKHSPSSSASPLQNECVVLLTGTTGGLGSSLLSILLESTEINRVYALNRKGTMPLEHRQKKAFRDRAIDESLIASTKLILLECDINKQDFGLEPSVLDEIRGAITHIIHNAYRVDFNISLLSFEENIACTRHLIDLALSSPRPSAPRFIFTSSVGVLRNYDGATHPVPEAPVDARSALGSGYSESKWVCEQILLNAHENTGLKPVIIRVGQLCGSSRNGFWTRTEWVPAIFESRAHTGCLPDLPGNVSWVPVDVAARSIIEMLDSNSTILHLRHPKPVSWTFVFRTAADALGLTLVPYTQWLQSLKKSIDVNEMHECSAARLLEFFESVERKEPETTEKRENDKEAMGLPMMSLNSALEESASLRKCTSLCSEDVERWLGVR